MKKIFLVLNPVAGDRAGDSVKTAIADNFSPGQVEIYETTGEEDMRQVVRNGVNNGAEWVFAAGGDGTVSTVADGLVGTNIPLGIIPVGTSNALARTLELPLNPEEMCRQLTGAVELRAIDAIKYGDGQYCFLQVGIGIDSRMMEATSREAKNRFGIAAYVGNAIQQTVGHDLHQYKIDVDGISNVFDASQVMILNASSLGIPGVSWGDHIALDDGVLDLCIMRLEEVTDYVEGIAGFLQDKPNRSENIQYLTAKHTIRVESVPPLPVQGDGEILGETPFSGELVPAAIQILIPC